jgi:hypothetical protein
MLEKQIEKKVVDYCRKRGFLCYKFSSPANRGVPDRIIIGKGKVLFLELKRKGEMPTALQFREIQRIWGMDGCATWADCVEAAVVMIEHYIG